MIAKQLIKEVPLASPETTGLVAMSLMDEHKLLHLPLVDEGEYLGIISETMIYNMANPELSILQSDIIPEKISATDKQHIYEIAELFLDNQLTLLPVLDEHQNYLGCITHTEILKAFGKFAAVCEPGGIIVLEIGERDYSLTEIANIVESNDARVLSVHTSTHEESTRMEVSIKINKMDIRPVLQTFNRYNYKVSASFQEAAYEDNLKERYDSLMNYLKL